MEQAALRPERSAQSEQEASLGHPMSAQMEQIEDDLRICCSIAEVALLVQSHTRRINEKCARPGAPAKGSEYIVRVAMSHSL
jgi:hypothetical protein